MRSTVAWHPDTRASLVLAAAAMLLVVAGFAALFSAAPRLKLLQDTGAAPEQLLLTEPMAAVPHARRPRHRVPAPVPQIPLLQNALPVPIVAPRPFTAQDYLDERAQQAAAALRDKVTAGDLQRDLGKVTQNPALSDMQGYRTVDGQRIVDSGGHCAKIQTVQGSSAPTNKTSVAEPTACPGGSADAGQAMAKALKDWADKVQQSRSPPSLR